MDEMTLLKDFRAAVAPPGDMALAQARARVMDGDGPGRGRPGHPWRHRPGTRGKLALTGLAGLAAAATAAVVAVAAPGAEAPRAGTPGPAGKEMAYRAAAAAAAGPEVAPGQWVYWQEKGYSAPEIGPTPNQTFQIWTTADATNAAYLSKGKVVLIPCGQQGPKPFDSCQSIGKPIVLRGPHGDAVGGTFGKIPVPYAGLRSLPDDPVALDRYLASLPREGWPSVPVFQFVVIKDLLTTYVMPPALTAELYRALGNIPGITVDQHAVDVTGRHGIGFRMDLSPGQAGSADELILDPETFTLMGEQLIAGKGGDVKAGQVLTGTAILKSALVSGPGIRP